MKRTIARLATFAAAVAGVLTLTAGPAAAAPVAGTHYGNVCSSRYLDNSGAESCWWADAFTPNYRVGFTLGAYDYAPDGLSVRNVTYVQQYVPGVGWAHQQSYTLTNSSGYRYTKVSGPLNVYKASNASHVRFVVNACTFDVPTNSYRSCANKVWSYSWAG